MVNVSDQPVRSLDPYVLYVHDLVGFGVMYQHTTTTITVRKSSAEMRVADNRWPAESVITRPVSAEVWDRFVDAVITIVQTAPSPPAQAKQGYPIDVNYSLSYLGTHTVYPTAHVHVVNNAADATAEAITAAFAPIRQLFDAAEPNPLAAAVDL
ncbi:hypothetical protein [Mycobacterium sp. D16Q16]|uniref:hypothetical protein n=1 Tax=Mycobacterium sp. D16Q16 TaxID=1855659 RepID=UPI000992AC88|nr:hypothetical protein [Mycobacterium sp. D16Q16]